jgi:predicted dehydrogenase
MDRVRCGVIGVGQLGQHHVRIYDDLPEAELIGIFDTDAARLREISERHSTRPFDSISGLIAEVDAISLAVPTSLHHEIGMQVLESGKHLLVEKPISSTAEEGLDLVSAAKSRDLILSVGHSERFGAPIRAALGYVKNPRFVEALRLAGFGPRGTDVSVIHDLMIHDIDLVLSLVSSEVERVEAVGVPVFTPNVDIANARLSFKDGTVATLTASRVSPERLRKVRFFQDDSYISVDLLGKAVNILKRKMDFAQMATIDPNDIRPDELVDVIVPPVEDREPLMLELLDFVLSVHGDKEPEVTGEAGLRALVVADQIVEDTQSRLRRWRE